jgi:hypothetical protein
MKVACKIAQKVNAKYTYANTEQKLLFGQITYFEFRFFVFFLRARIGPTPPTNYICYEKIICKNMSG